MIHLPSPDRIVRSSLLRLRARAIGSLLAAVFFAAAVADAQPAGVPSDRSRGEALFRDAKARVDKGDFEGGCPLYGESLAVLPSASTAIHIARCHEHFGRFASALAAYDQALALNGSTDAKRRAALEELASKGRQEMLAKTPKLVLSLDPRLRSASGLSITRDGVAIPAGELELGAPVDPGEHQIVASADGFVTRTLRVTTPAAELTTLEITLEPVAETKPGPPPELLPGSQPARREVAPPAADSRGGVPVWAWVSGAVGVAFVGVGVGLLVDSRLAADRLDACESFGEADLYACPTQDYESLEAIESDIGRADIGLGVGVSFLSAGAAGLALGIIGVATAPSAGDAGASVSVVPLATGDFAGVSIRGRL